MFALKRALNRFGYSFKPYSSCSEPLVTVENRESVTLIGINRPERRNCVNIETAQQLLRAFEQFDGDDSSPVAVLHGHGGTFCAGFDLQQLSQMDAKDGNIDMSSLLFRGPMGPSQMLTSKPIIAAIDGYAVAGGLELALMCDLRIVEDNAIMGVFCRRFGVPLIDGGTVRLTKLIGLSRALDLILTGRAIDAKEALSFGLANRLCTVGTSLGSAFDFAHSLIKFPQQCLKADRRSAYYATYDAKSMEDALIFEYENGKQVIETESIKGATRFIKEGVGKHGKFVLSQFEHEVKVTV